MSAPPTDRTTRTARRVPVGRFVLVIMFSLISINALREAYLQATTSGQRWWTMLLLQLISGLLALGSVVALLRRARWTKAIIGAWGVFCAAFVASLGALLDLPADARPGLWIGAAVVLVMAGVSVLYLVRAESMERVAARVAEPTTQANKS